MLIPKIEFWKMIFLFNYVSLRLPPLIFRGVSDLWLHEPFPRSYTGPVVMKPVEISMNPLVLLRGILTPHERFRRVCMYAVSLYQSIYTLYVESYEKKPKELVITLSCAVICLVE